MANDKEIMKIENQNLQNKVWALSNILDKEYLSRLNKDFEVKKLDGKDIVDYKENLRAVRVTRWVFNKEEKPGECFKNVLNLFADGRHTIALVVKRKKDISEMYFVVKSQGRGNNEASSNDARLLKNAIEGNFPGTKAEAYTTAKDIDKTKKEFSFFGEDNDESVAVMTNIPSEFSEDHLTQGLEKLLNGLIPKEEREEYSVVFLAESLSPERVKIILSGYEELATYIEPFLQYQFQFGENKSETQGTTETESTTESVFKVNSVFGSVGVNLGKIQPGVGVGRSKGKSTAKGNTWGKNRSVSYGNTQSTTYTHKSYMVANMLDKLEKTMNHIKEGQGTGLWKYSAYIVANDSHTTRNVANYLRALTQGNESYIEPAFVQEWSSSGESDDSFERLKNYIKYFIHPVFVEKGESVYKAVTPTAYVATNELGYVMSFPRKSVSGLPVIEGVQFGREPHSLSRMTGDVKLGCAYHMYNEIQAQEIKLSKEELTKHVFITGSTGAGKSNAIYKILESLAEQGIGFLVIEPAKGEYKDVIGKNSGVITYGTRPGQEECPLLRINPFRFPKSVHILEHLDRLVEIFNACWPMYAAMPAILKNAMEKAYEISGWDLAESKNKYSEELFPTFADLLEQIKAVLDESDYSSDNKSDYTGALVTRVRSLTNGINGLIFSTNDLADEELFDGNVIVDLSKVGSTETKALIMGILVLKLQEHRMDGSKPNSNLRHITVLEEAHNLLRRTSTEQFSESANLLGKSVEMLTNAIAEMRTYGEGFIIADQSPGLLDMAVIRNTNTKIIMRLPDISDRDLVGKAASLNDNQVMELARLETGVAAVTQSGWLEPVLCKVDKYDGSKEKAFNFGNKHGSTGKKTASKIDVKKEVIECIFGKELYRKSEKAENAKKPAELKSAIIDSSLATKVKCEVLEYLYSNITASAEKKKLLRALAFDFFDAEKAVQKSKCFNDIGDLIASVVDKLKPSVKEYPREEVNWLLDLVMQELYFRNPAEFSNVFFRFTEMRREGRMF